MKKILVSIISFVFATSVFSQDVPSRRSEPSKPNILFVFIDDMGYADLGCYGNDEAKTPEIDRLAAEGIRFTQFYSNAPICSPSRVSVLTGQYPGRWEITSYIDSRAKNQARGMRDYLDPAAPSVARILSDAGYYTAHIGKWHLGGGRDVGEAPLITEYGFHESVSQFEGLGERYLATYETLNLKDSTRQLEKWSAALGRGTVHWEKRYRVTERFVDRAIDAIGHAREAGKPFFINLWPDDVHTPLEPSPANRTSTDKRDLYLAVLTEMDRQLGRIFEQIRRDPTLSANTIIVVTSDNGPEPGAGSAEPFRGTKGSLYEGGIREPLIVWYPGKMRSGKRGTVNTKNVIAAMDLPRSFAALARADEGYAFDGEDVSALFTGKAKSPRKEAIMWQRPPDRKMLQGISQPDLAIREGDFKLVIDSDGSDAKLFDVAKDAEESRDISGEHEEVVKKLSEKVLSWYASLPSKRPE